jgi:hypothetical protein
MTKSKGVGRTGRPKSTPLGPGIPGTARTAKPGTVEAIEDVLALMAVENAKPNPNLGRQRSYSDILGAHQKLLARADAESADCTRTALGKARAAALAEQEGLAAKQKASELAASEAECAEIDRRHERERLRPGPPDIGREGTDARAAYDSQQAADGRARQKLAVLRGEKTQDEVDKENRNAVEARERK